MGDVDRQRENHEKRRQWIAVLRKDRARRPLNAKTTINFDAAFVGKSADADELLAWFEKQEAATYPARCAR